MVGSAAEDERRTRLILFRTHTAVFLTALVAILSIVTGIVNISSTTLSGPLAVYVPELAARTAGFTGTMTGFLMLVSVYGLRRGYRSAWYLSAVLLPVTGLQGLVQSSLLSLPLVVASVLATPAVLLNRRFFDRTVDLTMAQLASLAAIVSVQVYGTVGTYALREEFNQVNTVLDAFYFTLVTASTVGYGDLTATSQFGRLFSMSVLLAGVASFGVALGTLLGPLIEARLATALGNMSDKQLELLENHYVVTGYGELTEPILESLDGNNAVVIVRDPEDTKQLREHGHEVFTADPSDEEPLRRVHIERARALIVATNDDAQDAMAVLTARELNPELRIVAAATDRENISKLRRAGADIVLSPAVLGGQLLVESALGNDNPERVIDRILDIGSGGRSS
ncbi:NAD-binding protein [Natronomonas sp. F2-12]|jgi:voltage-gated potassium channel|uniref:NAD-binding protein n=1 Tax=Natronomonas aquatica TaxID=2841590 RepID=A0A9R1D5W3_9EURY|nr:NAD-binding protein [Natronomonas aquatica]MCQ4332317.1 NAD-binding protein [Natronomonas aquatica]